MPNPSRKPRVLFLVNIPRFFLSHRLPLAVAALEAGYEVHVATGQGDPQEIARIREAGITHHEIYLSQHSINPVRELRTVLAMAWLYLRLWPDILHLVSVKPVMYGSVLARLMRLPAVVVLVTGLGYGFAEKEGKKPRFDLFHFVQDSLYKIGLAYRRCFIIFQNPDNRDYFLRHKVNTPERMRLIRGSGVDLAVFNPQPEPQDGLPVVLFGGRLMWNKGVGDFAAVAKALKGRARFVLVGFAEPQHPDRVPQSQIEAWVNDGVLEFWGQRSDMANVFAACNVFLYPSNYGEGVPKVLIEAAACGRACVTTDTEGCREVVRDGENGFLVPAGDIPAMVAAVARLLDDPALRGRMATRSHEIAQQEFSLQRVLDETLAFYQHIIRLTMKK